MDKQINQLLEAIGETIVEFIQLELVSINLKDSNLYKNITYSIKDYTVTIEIPDYYKFIESGRKPLSKRVPTSVLIKWLLIKGLDKNNKTVFAIQNSIYKKGIKPRPFLETAMKDAQKEIQDLLALDFSDIVETQIKKVTR